ncbi:MAG: aminopeptidase [Bdellovibrionales bacterium]
MRILILILSIGFLTSSCGITYYAKIGIHQASILWNREDINQVLQSDNITQKEKQKLQLIEDVRKFIDEELPLQKSTNYTTYSKLDDDYVSYVVHAAPINSTVPYKWNYPIVGKLSYKGFPKKEDALKEAHRLEKEGYETYVRGVSAYSTLGWFRDPVLSSMLSYPDSSLVDLIIHESTHETIYVKSNADFNEQLASFVGRVGTELYYEKKEGLDSPTIRKLLQKKHDTRIFSKFIGNFKKELENWYKENSIGQHKDQFLKKRALKIRSMQIYFTKEVQPKLQLYKFNSLLSKDLNNARISVFSTYLEDQSQFQTLFNQSENFKDFFEKLLTLKSSMNPKEDLAKIIKN